MSGHVVAASTVSNPDQGSTSEGMPWPGSSVVGFSAELLSAIRNLVCPACGGPLDGRSRVFKCRGQCGTDWRSVWEHATAG